MGSALLNPGATQEFAETPEFDARYVKAGHASVVPKTVEDLRREVAEHLAAHRSRRNVVQQAVGRPDAAAPAETRTARIAAAVAERYSQTPSYREVLAAEAERATQKARAEAEVAAMNAQAVAAAQLRLLAAYDEHVERGSAAVNEAVAIELWPATTADATEAAPVAAVRRSAKREVSAPAVESGRATACVDATGELTVRLYEDATNLMRRGETVHAATAVQRHASIDTNAEEAKALDEEIAFRQTPVFEEAAGPAVNLPANLIEFPRQLVAARKARPRHAEGPLREENDAEANDGQLRIFEVEQGQISIAPEIEQGGRAQWTSIWLDAPAVVSREAVVEADAAVGAQIKFGVVAASLGRRAGAGAINLAVIGAGTIGFLGTAAYVIARGSGIAWPAGLSLGMSVRAVATAFVAQAGVDGKTAWIAAAVSGVLLVLLYHALFALFAEGTPGMRCVRIAFCTFEDESPEKRAIRRRALARLVSVLPVGMGYAWAAIDEDRLTWHDRMSGMYLRRY